jgi:(2S)-methylsuccinyl-CoA dehydrogenase
MSVTASLAAVDKLPQLLAQADSELDCLRAFVDSACASIRLQCLVDAKLDAELLDNWQLVSYELAFCVAEISAAKAFIGYALQLEQSEITQKICLSFCAETLQTVLQRLIAQSAELGVPRAQLLDVYARPCVKQLLDTYLGSELLGAIGGEISESDLQRLPSILDEEKELVRATFFRFANDVVTPLAAAIHREDQDIPDSILKPVAELGCFGTCIPERFGGLQPDDRPDSLGMIVGTEELSRGSLGAAGSLITRPEIAARSLLSGGTAAQQQKGLPKLAAGELLCAISITEPNTGSDVAAVSLKATASLGGWLLNGSKTWCTFAGRSELIVVLARSNPDRSLGYKGLSLFMLEKPAYSGNQFKHEQRQGGSLSGNAIATLGYRGMHSYDLFFEDYFVPAENLIGEQQGEGRGFYYTMAGFAGGRIQTAARATGVMQAAFESALRYAR